MFNTMFSALDKNKTPTTEEIEKISSFIFCKWLAGSPSSIFKANEINLYYDIPMVNQYFLIKHSLAGKVRNVKYVKTDKHDSPDIDLMIRHFKISKFKALEYLKIIDRNELNNIRELYTQK